MHTRPVALITDNALLERTLRRELMEYGYRVSCHETPKDFQAAFANTQNLALVITDDFAEACGYKHPLGHAPARGLDLAESLNQTDPTLPVTVVTRGEMAFFRAQDLNQRNIIRHFMQSMDGSRVNAFHAGMWARHNSRPQFTAAKTPE